MDEGGGNQQVIDLEAIGIRSGGIHGDADACGAANRSMKKQRMRDQIQNRALKGDRGRLPSTMTVSSSAQSEMTR